MTEHLLRIEAVNLAHVTDDTDQISVIRGGGLAALEGARIALTPLAPLHSSDAEVRVTAGLWQRILNWLRGPRGVPPSLPGAADSACLQVERISLGASVGLYRLVPTDPSTSESPAMLRERIAAHLSRDFPHHTFVVDVEPMEGEAGFPDAHQRVIARNRWRQLAQPTLAWPQPATPGSGAMGPCREDDLRPAVTPSQGRSPGLLEGTSASVQWRFEKGRLEKRGFLSRESGIDDLDYSHSFEDLARGHHDRRLDNKLAVLYFDGNGFGGIQSQCKTPAALHDFDQYMRAQRKALLARLLADLRQAPDARVLPREPSAPETLRFELLLWGGDELQFVVPAWLGLHALSLFYESSAHWRWPADAGASQLTHAGAIVFCHYKTPIGRITRLARELAEGVKDSPGGRGCNRFDYLVLESIDFPAEPVERYRRGRFAPLTSTHPWRPLDLPAPPITLRQAAHALARIRDAGRLPRGKIHDAAQGFVTRGDDPIALGKAVAALEQTLDRSAEAHTETRQAQADLTRLRETRDALFPGQEPAWAWLHLAGLWDYLGSREAGAAT